MPFLLRKTAKTTSKERKLIAATGAISHRSNFHSGVGVAVGLGEAEELGLALALVDGETFSVSAGPVVVAAAVGVEETVDMGLSDGVGVAVGVSLGEGEGVAVGMFFKTYLAADSISPFVLSIMMFIARPSSHTPSLKPFSVDGIVFLMY